MYDEAFYSSLGPLLDAEELSGDPQHFGDRGHFNRSGTDLVSAWMNQAIDRYLTPLRNPAYCTK